MSVVSSNSVGSAVCDAEPSSLNEGENSSVLDEVGAGVMLSSVVLDDEPAPSGVALDIEASPESCICIPVESDDDAPSVTEVVSGASSDADSLVESELGAGVGSETDVGAGVGSDVGAAVGFSVPHANTTVTLVTSTNQLSS